MGEKQVWSSNANGDPSPWRKPEDSRARPGYVELRHCGEVSEGSSQDRFKREPGMTELGLVR